MVSATKYVCDFGQIFTSPFPYLKKKRVVLRPHGSWFLTKLLTCTICTAVWGRKDILHIYSVQMVAKDFAHVISFNPLNNLIRLHYSYRLQEEIEGKKG